MTQPTSPDDVMDVYVPGNWSCPKCGYVLSSQTLFMATGEIGCTRDQVMAMTGEACPNDGEPMRRVTWRERADDNRKWGESLMETIIAATGAEHLPGALAAVKERFASSHERGNDENPCCSGCGGPHPFDTTVPSVRWNSVIRKAGLPDYLCLTCIVTAFVKAGESFTAELVGGEHQFEPIEVRTRGQHATDAQALSSENTELRARIRELDTQSTALPAKEWHEDDGDVLWWRFPIVEPPYVGSPLASDWPFDEGDLLGWTRLVCPGQVGA